MTARRQRSAGRATSSSRGPDRTRSARRRTVEVRDNPLLHRVRPARGLELRVAEEESYRVDETWGLRRRQAGASVAPESVGRARRGNLGFLRVFFPTWEGGSGVWGNHHTVSFRERPSVAHLAGPLRESTRARLRRFPSSSVARLDRRARHDRLARVAIGSLGACSRPPPRRRCSDGARVDGARMGALPKSPGASGCALARPEPSPWTPRGRPAGSSRRTARF